MAGAEKFVLEPIRKDLGEIDEPIDAVLCMADTFVRIGCLQTVREIEEYIITTARVSFINVCDIVLLTQNNSILPMIIHRLSHLCRRH